MGCIASVEAGTVAAAAADVQIAINVTPMCVYVQNLAGTVLTCDVRADETVGGQAARARRRAEARRVFNRATALIHHAVG